MVTYEIDGYVGGALKCVELDDKKIDIQRSGETGDVFAFAQQDVVGRFLYGIDEEYELAIVDYFEKAIITLADVMVDLAVKGSNNKKASARESLHAVIRKIQDEYFQKSAPDLQQAFFPKYWA